MENPPSTAASSSRNTRTTAGGTSVSSHPMLRAASSYTFQPDAAVLERLANHPEGAKCETVNRLVCKGVVYEIEFLIDVNSELFECEEGDKLTVALATSLSVDGVSEAKAIDYARGAKASLLDQFDYAMHGTVYKFEHVKDTKVEVYVSHGGLLARFRGDQRHVLMLMVDAEVFSLLGDQESVIAAAAASEAEQQAMLVVHARAIAAEERAEQLRRVPLGAVEVRSEVLVRRVGGVLLVDERRDAVERLEDVGVGDDAVVEPVGEQLRRDAQRRAVLHQLDAFDRRHLRAADALRGGVAPRRRAVCARRGVPGRVGVP